MASLLELAERVQAATGPDREMDAAIAQALGYVVTAEQCQGKLRRYYGAGALGEVARLTKKTLPRFTASVDDAMKLVPEGDGAWPQVEYIGPNPNDAGRGHRWRIWRQSEGRISGHSLAGSALALTAAALRARSEP